MQSFLPTVKIVTTDNHMTSISKAMPTFFENFEKSNFGISFRHEKHHF